MVGQSPRGIQAVYLVVRQSYQFRLVFVLTGLTCLLSLVPTVFLLQVYERVLNGRNTLTLYWLLVPTITAYILIAVFQWARSSILQHLSMKTEDLLRRDLISATLEANRPSGIIEGPQIEGDIVTIREFLSSSALLGILELPSAMLILSSILLINLSLGLLVLAAAVAHIILWYFLHYRNQWRLPVSSVQDSPIQQSLLTQSRTSRVIHAMGMTSAAQSRWRATYQNQLGVESENAEQDGTVYVTTKAIQTILNIMLLFAASWLLISAKLPQGPSIIIFTSALAALSLRPLAQIINGWRQINAFRSAIRRVDTVLRYTSENPNPMFLAPPLGHLSVDHVTAGPTKPTLPLPPPHLIDLTFSIKPNEILAIIGPSGSGKSTLAQLLVGLRPPHRGTIRLDGADMSLWNKDQLIKFVGYLPQKAELLDGITADYIARFGKPDIELLTEARQLSGLDDWLPTQSDWHHSPIENNGEILASGVRQRIALARAFYGNPVLLVLDAPDSNLDERGVEVLRQSLRLRRQKPTTTVIITHNVVLLQEVDEIVVLAGGTIRAHGPREELLPQFLHDSISARTAAKTARTEAA